MKRLFALLLLAGVANAQAANQAVLTWTAPTLNTDGTTITAALTYNVYQGAKGSTTKASASTGLPGLTTTIFSGLLPGTTVCFEVTAVAGGQESAHSGEVCKTFPASVPSAPTLTVQ